MSETDALYSINKQLTRIADFLEKLENNQGKHWVEYVMDYRTNPICKICFKDKDSEWHYK
jgi:hypothetical protein